MSHATDALSRFTQSLREGLQLSSSVPSQTAAAPEFGQLIRLLEDKLAQGSDADISLSVNDAQELVRALRFSKDANDRLPVVEQELAEAKQGAGVSLFFSKYGDYSGKVWNDITSLNDARLPKLATEASAAVAKDLSGEVEALQSCAESLRPPLSYQAVRCALDAYSRRCELFHSMEVYKINKATIGPRADADLEALSTYLPRSWLVDRGNWQDIINYVKFSRGPQGDKNEEATSSDQVSDSRRSGLTSIQSQVLVNLAAGGILPRSTTPFLLDFGVFGASPVASVSPVARSRRGRSAPPLATRKRKRPADADDLLYPPFAKRQAIELPPGQKANDDAKIKSERRTIEKVDWTL